MQEERTNSAPSTAANNTSTSDADARAKYLERVQSKFKEERVNLETELDEVIAVLQRNRGHIAGFSIVLISGEHDTIVSPDGEASDGYRNMGCLCDAHGGSVALHLGQQRDLFMRPYHASEILRGGGIAGLLAGLKG